jgi:hypothetical protein
MSRIIATRFCDILSLRPPNGAAVSSANQVRGKKKSSVRQSLSPSMPAFCPHSSTAICLDRHLQRSLIRSRPHCPSKLFTGAPTAPSILIFTARAQPCFAAKQAGATAKQARPLRRLRRAASANGPPVIVLESKGGSHGVKQDTDSTAVAPRSWLAMSSSTHTRERKSRGSAIVLVTSTVWWKRSCMLFPY